MRRAPRTMEEADALAHAEQWPEAVAAYQEILNQGKPSFALRFGLGCALIRIRRLEEGRDQLEEALTQRPDSAETLSALAVVSLRLNDPTAAENACRRLLTLQPGQASAWRNLGIALSFQGRSEESQEAMERAVRLKPKDPIARSNFLLSLNYTATNGTWLADRHRHLCSGLPSAPRKPMPDPRGRRIRLGYVSGDFRRHSVAFFLRGLLASIDRDSFEVFCYSGTKNPDETTRQFARITEHFVDIAGLDDGEAAGRIEADGVDLLVDLGGHTQGGRLGLFALRPAPVQATYLGYPATTGCPFIDYRLVDALTDPEGSETHCTERLIRLPAPFLCFSPPADPPEPGPPPMLSHGFPTFGSFNHLSKLTDPTLDLWSDLLTAVPQAHLFLKTHEFADPSVRERFRQRFAARGIAGDRVEFSGPLERYYDHLAAYRQVDIALDPFPYHGTTTTCEALLMGVPVISQVGGLHAARVGLTLLSAVALRGLAAATAEEYVGLAMALSEEPGQLATLRKQLPQVVLRSPLCDDHRLARGMEEAVRHMLATSP